MQCQCGVAGMTQVWGLKSLYIPVPRPLAMTWRNVHAKVQIPGKSRFTSLNHLHAQLQFLVPQQSIW